MGCWWEVLEALSSSESARKLMSLLKGLSIDLVMSMCLMISGDLRLCI